MDRPSSSSIRIPARRLGDFIAAPSPVHDDPPSFERQTPDAMETSWFYLWDLCRAAVLFVASHRRIGFSGRLSHADTAIPCTSVSVEPVEVVAFLTWLDDSIATLDRGVTVGVGDAIDIAVQQSTRRSTPR
jgi:hypothetical protein